jgi:hypothetical protein
MKTNITSNWRPLLRALYAFPIAIAALWVVPRNAWAQLYVTKPLLPPGLSGVVSTYEPSTGALIKAKLIAGANFPEALALNGSILFVANGGDNTVGKYDASGAPINASFITGLKQPAGLAVQGNRLFVTNSRAGTVGEYYADSGAPINASFITGLNGPAGLALLGSTLFVANSGAGTVGKYEVGNDPEAIATTINTSFITGLSVPVGLAVKNDNTGERSRGTPQLFVANSGAGTVGKYDAVSVVPSNASFIKGLNSPVGLALLGETLFVTSSGAGTVGTYDAQNGGAKNASLVTGLLAPAGIAVKSDSDDSD